MVDCDTFRIGSPEERLGVWGLDAPEAGATRDSHVTATPARMIDGRTLSCRQRDIDRYGRIVGPCFTADGRDITAKMISNGPARGYCRHSKNGYRTC